MQHISQECGYSHAKAGLTAITIPYMVYFVATDWNTSSDEDAVPELKLVSCAALACLLKHTGLSSSASCNSR